MGTLAPSRRLVLHMGMHKTGSSALQVAFVRNREAQRAAGVWYPYADNDAAVRAGGIESGNGMRLAWSLMPAIAPPELDPDREIDELLAIVLGSEVDRVLYSSEFLYRFEPDRWDAFVARADAAGVSIDCVVYSRSVASHASSFYGQDVKRGLYTGTMDEYVALDGPGGYHLWLGRCVETLVSTVGAEHVRVVSYEQVRSRIVDHFYDDVLGISVDPGSDRVPETINRSPSMFEVEVMRLTNSLIDDHDTARRISDALIADDPPDAARLLLSHHACDVLRHRFADEVAQVNATGVLDHTLEVVPAELERGDVRPPELTSRERHLARVITALAGRP